MHFSIKLKYPSASFSIPYFANVSFIIQNNKYQEITIAKSTRKTVRRDAATGCFITH